jgi:hypothetical protein
MQFNIRFVFDLEVLAFMGAWGGGGFFSRLGRCDFVNPAGEKADT